jgi:hypothetical protein
MSRTALRQLLAGALVVGAGLVGFVKPAYACHEPTGWCCIGGGEHPFCCYFEENQIIGCVQL